MLGKTEVSEPEGSHVVRDAMHAIQFQLQAFYNLLLKFKKKKKFNSNGSKHYLKHLKVFDS